MIQNETFTFLANRMISVSSSMIIIFSFTTLQMESIHKVIIITHLGLDIG